MKPAKQANQQKRLSTATPTATPKASSKAKEVALKATCLLMAVIMVALALNSAPVTIASAHTDGGRRNNPIALAIANGGAGSDYYAEVSTSANLSLLSASPDTLLQPSVDEPLTTDIEAWLEEFLLTHGIPLNKAEGVRFCHDRNMYFFPILNLYFSRDINK